MTEMTGWPQSRRTKNSPKFSRLLQSHNYTFSDVIAQNYGNLAASTAIFMVALWNRADHYIFALWFLLPSFFISSPNLSRRRLDVSHISTHANSP